MIHVKEYPISEEQARELFIEHSPYVYGIALMLTKSKMLADDMTQETFLRAFQKYHTYDVSRPLRPWLYRITMNLVRSNLRKQRWLSFWGQVPAYADEVVSIEELILKSERERELWLSVNTLTKKRREVIVLHYYAEMSLPEVASILDIHLGTCKSRLHAALKQLRDGRESVYYSVSHQEEVK